MNLKIGDKVIINEHGYAFYGNLNRVLEMRALEYYSDEKNLKDAFCEILAIQGVGEVVGFNDLDDPIIKFKYSTRGMFYWARLIICNEDVSKLSFFQKLKYKLLGRI